MLTKEKKLELERFSKQIQMKTIETIASLGVGHVGGALSIADLLAVLYGKQMNVRPEEPRWEDRDWLVVSKGHAGRPFTLRLRFAAFSRWSSSTRSISRAPTCRVTATATLPPVLISQPVLSDRARRLPQVLRWRFKRIKRTAAYF